MVSIFWWEQTERCIYLETGRYTNLNIKLATLKKFPPRPWNTTLLITAVSWAASARPEASPENRASPRTAHRTHPGTGERKTTGNKANTDACLCAPLVVSINLLFMSVFYTKTLVKGKDLQHLAHFVRRETRKRKQTKAFQFRPPEDLRELLSSLRILSVEEKGAGHLFFFLFSFLWKWKSLSHDRLLATPWTV